MNTPFLVKRGLVFYFRRPIPKHVQHVWKKKEVMVSLKTRELQVALERYTIENNKMNAQLRCIEVSGRFGVSGPSADVLREMFELRTIHASAIDILPIETLFQTISANVAALNSWPVVTKPQVAALAATIQTRLSWKEVFDRFKQLDRDHFSPKHDKRARDKRYTPKSSAYALFDTLFPDTNVLAITNADVEAFKEKLLDLVDSGKYKADTADKKIGHLRTMFEKVRVVDFKHLENPFDGVFIKIHEIGKRKPFSEEDIAKILKHFAESNASDELKALTYIAMNTGAHQKELVFLTPDDIRLDDPIPHIHIGPNEYRDRAKTESRHRDLPLIGLALEWAKKFPYGFPTYCKSGGADNLSAAVNKHLRPLTGKTFYSFRHRIKDALRNSGCSDSLQDAILGHKTPGMGSHYGDGYTLEKKQESLKLALKIN